MLRVLLAYRTRHTYHGDGHRPSASPREPTPPGAPKGHGIICAFRLHPAARD